MRSTDEIMLDAIKSLVKTKTFWIMAILALVTAIGFSIMLDDLGDKIENRMDRRDTVYVKTL